MNDNDRAIVGLVMVAHALVHTYELSIPIFMTIWLSEFSVTASVLGGVVTAGYFLFGVGALPGGILSDRFGSRRLIAFCLAGMGLSFLLLSVAQSVWMVGAALVAWGAAASVYHPAGLSLISTGVRQRGKALAWHGIAGNVGIALGPLATALLLVVLDWPWVAALLAVPAALATTYALASSFDEYATERPTVDAPTPTTSDAGAAGRSDDAGWVEIAQRLLSTSRHLFATRFAAVFAIVMLSGLYYRGTLTFLPDLLTPLVTLDLPVDLEAGRYVYAGLLMVGILGQYTGGRLTDRFPTEQAMSLALLALSVVALAFLPVAQLGTVALLGASAVLGFVLFLVQPLYQATVAEYTPSRARGLSYGFTYLGVFGIGALGAVVAGVLLEHFHPSTLFGVLAGFAALGALLSAWLATRDATPADATHDATTP